jgi:hypothetical protein
MKINLNYTIYHGKSELNRFSINSLDVNSNKNILVTCGKDFLIKIWDLNFIGKNKNKKFCHIIDNHKKSINVVRWSPDAELLASGGDDGHLIIHSINTSSYNSIGCYRVFYNFRNNQHDIVCLCWSPDSSFLSTTSICGNIFIYSIKKKQIFAKITGKIFTLHGSCWDPLGFFFITQSNTGGIKIWDILNWKIFKTVEFFSEYKTKSKYPQKSITGKPVWTSCGKFIILFNNSTFKHKHYIKAIERREDFRKYKVFFHGKKLISIVKVSPRIYSKNSYDRYISIFAVATEQGGIYFWAPGCSRVLILIKNLSGKSFTDLNWNFNGYDLFLAASKGELYKITFDRFEFGRTLKMNDHASFLRNFYKKKPLIFTNYLFSTKKNRYSIKYFMNILFLGNLEIKKSILKAIFFSKQYSNIEKKFRKYQKISFQKCLDKLNKIKQNFILKFKKQYLSWKFFHFLWFRNKSQYCFLQKQRSSIKYKGISSKFPINIIKNQFCTILNLSKGRSFQVRSLVEKNHRKFYVKYIYQINDMSLKKNFIFIASTKRKINIINVENFQKLFYINLLDFSPQYSIKFDENIFLQLLKCSGIIICC